MRGAAKVQRHCHCLCVGFESAIELQFVEEGGSIIDGCPTVWSSMLVVSAMRGERGR